MYGLAVVWLLVGGCFAARVLCCSVEVSGATPPVKPWRVRLLTSAARRVGVVNGAGIAVLRQDVLACRWVCSILLHALQEVA